MSPSFATDDPDTPLAAESWLRIQKHFEPSAEFTDDMGAYRSPLIFHDKSTVRTADDWNRRRAELLEQWTELLGHWPPLITQPQVEVLETKQREDFQQHRIRFEWMPDQLTTGYLLIPDGCQELRLH